MADPFELVSAGDLASLRDGLAAGAVAAATRNPGGTSLLSWAAYMRNGEAITIIRQALPELDPYEACILGDRERVAAALAGGWDPNALAPDGFSALGLAAFFGQSGVFDLLLPLTADVNQQARNPQRVAALHAATATRNAAMVENLLRAGADPNLAQAAGILPIHVAAQHGDAAVTALLLLFGADPARADDKGRTAIDFARAGGQTWLVERLAAQVTSP